MRKLLWFALGFCGACLLAAYLLSPAQTLPIAGGAAAAAVLLRLLRRRWEPLFAVALGLGFGMLWFWGYHRLAIAPAFEAAGSYEEASVQIAGYPRKTRYGYSVEAYALTGDRSSRIKLYLEAGEADLRPGDVLSGSLDLRRSDRSRDGSDYYYDISHGIVLVGTCGVRAVSHGELPVRAIPLWVTEQIKAALRRAAPADAAPFLTAILTGDRSDMPYGMQQDLRTAGLSHVIAVSGMHVSVLMGALYLLFGRGGRLSAVLGIPILLFFALMTGLSASVLRATLMLSLFLLAPLLHRERDTLTLLAAAALLILLQNPWAVTDVSFQLSFLAMTGLLLFTGPLYRYFLETNPWKAMAAWRGPGIGPIRLRNALLRLWGALVRGLLAGICCSLGALALTLPLTAYLYGTVSTYTLAANLLALWAIPLCFVGGLVTAFAALAYLPLGRAAGWLTAWPVRLILWISRRLSALPMASLPVSSLYTKLFLAFACGTLLLVLLLRERRYGKPLLCIAAGLAAAALFVRLDSDVRRFTVTVLDVGQGQCVCLRTEDFSAVIDCGGSDGDAAGAKAARYLRNAGVSTLDALILTHYDKDHVGGVGELFRQIDIGTVYLEDVPFETAVREEIERTAASYGTAVAYVTADRQLTVSEGSLTIFAPVTDADENAASLAVLFEADDFTMLVTGDMDQYAETRLLAAHTLPTLSLLVVGHHGSENSTGLLLLRELRPETAVISVGKNNYGHPSRGVLRRLQAYDAAIYRTDLNGDLEIRR